MALFSARGIPMLAAIGTGERSSSAVGKHQALQRDAAMGTVQTEPLLRRAATHTEELDHRAAVGESG